MGRHGERDHVNGDQAGAPVRNEMPGHAGAVVQVGGNVGTVTFTSPPPPSATPSQVPPPPGGFVDRDKQIDLLRSMAEHRRVRGERPAVAAIRGLPGVGKTALLRQTAAMIAGHFPDGVLHADFGPLRHRGGAAVSEVAAGMLNALGVAEQWIPVDFRRRVDLLRSITADLRLLVVLDDVFNDAQVTALLPNSPSSMVLVAGIRSLDGLLLDGAVDLALAPLDPEHAMRLLAKMCPDGRIVDGGARELELVRLCGHLPLALRVAGARLATRPGWTVSDLVSELADVTRALDELSAGGRSVVQAVFDLVYQDLPKETARVYRHLGLLVGPHFGAEVVAAMCGLPDPTARRALDDLRQVSLVEEGVDRTCQLHRLVRLHAMRRSEHEDSEEVRARALCRALDWWLFGARTADVAVTGVERLRIADYGELLGGGPSPVARDAGLDWLDREHANLLGLMRAAAERGWHDKVWQLFEALYPLYDNRKPLTAWVEAGELAVAASRECAHRPAEARMRCLLAKAFQECERYPDAHAQLAEARTLAEHLDDQRLIASTLDFSGNVHLRQGESDAALAYFRRALLINERLGEIRGTAMQSQFVGRALGKLGRTDDALAALERARKLVDSVGDSSMPPKIMLSTGRVLFDAHRDGEADVVLRDALDRARRSGLSAVEADIMRMLARVARRRGDVTSEQDYLRQAATAYARMGSPKAARIYAQLPPED